MTLLDRLLRRKRSEPQPGPQGEEYEALKMARRAAEDRNAFAENLVEKAGHTTPPYPELALRQ
jgi:hypothetical protein